MSAHPGPLSGTSTAGILAHESIPEPDMNPRVVSIGGKQIKIAVTDEVVTMTVDGIEVAVGPKGPLARQLMQELNTTPMTSAISILPIPGDLVDNPSGYLVRRRRA